MSIHDYEIASTTALRAMFVGVHAPRKNTTDMRMWITGLEHHGNRWYTISRFLLGCPFPTEPVVIAEEWPLSKGISAGNARSSTHEPKEQAGMCCKRDVCSSPGRGSDIALPRSYFLFSSQAAGQLLSYWAMRPLLLKFGAGTASTLLQKTAFRRQSDYSVTRSRCVTAHYTMPDPLPAPICGRFLLAVTHDVPGFFRMFCRANLLSA